MSKTHLEFVLSESSFSATLINEETITHLGSILFLVKKEFQIKEQIQQFLESKDLINSEYDDYSLAWSSKLSTLVPMNIFGVSSATEIFQACFTNEIITNDIDYNRLAELSLVNVYEIPLWVKSYFVIRFPRIIIQHEGSHFLRGIFSNSTFKLGAHLVLHDQYFMLVLVKHNELLFYNQFDYSNEEDVLYYLTFSLKQKQFLGEEGQLFIHESAEINPAFSENFLSKINLLTDLKKMTVMDSKHLSVKYQNTCV
ncbi:MAG: DUF3822 family protein [Crocinitomicaceae bacterium]|nr:DUF3822 family protein [Crocinitomicaceae bacterium]